jgi:hypothetical protein
METELVALLGQAPALVIIVWLVMKQQNGNGNGQTELIRAIAHSIEKLADAQTEANRIAEQRQKGFEKWLDLQKQTCQQQFVSRNQK